MDCSDYQAVPASIRGPILALRAVGRKVISHKSFGFVLGDAGTQASVSRPHNVDSGVAKWYFFGGSETHVACRVVTMQTYSSC